MDEASRYRERASQDSNDDVFVRWECKRGHQWDDALDHAQNVLCMNCAAQRRETETTRAHMVAQVRGGTLISPGYANGATGPTWQCAYGHVWDAHADAAQRRWCVQCARTVFARYR